MSRLAVAAALRTRPADVGAVWGALSSQLSEVAFRYAEGVGVRCWPKASVPAPGCCFLESGTILLDGDLIGDPESLRAAVPSAQLRADLAVLTGVLLHECGHANHSMLAVKAACFEAGFAREHTMLEEPRMETQMCRRFPVARKFIQAAVSRLNVEHMPDPGELTGRSAAIHVGVIVGGRENAGSAPPAVIGRAWEIVETAIGADDAAKLRDLLRRACDIADEDTEATIEACRELHELIGEEASMPLPSEVAEALRGLIEELLEEAAGRAAAEAASDPDGEVGEMIEALAEETGSELERKGERIVQGRGRDGGFACKPGGPPGPAEKRAARAMEVELRRVRARRTAREGSRVPGRFKARRAMSSDSDRARGVMRVPEPYERRVEVKARLWAPEVGVAIDTSGSMSTNAAALSSVLWVAARAIRRIGGRLCAVGFGDDGELILGPGESLATVPEFSCNGGTERFDLAAPILGGELRLHDRRRPRLLVIVSDGVWVTHSEESEAELRKLREAGVATVHVNIGGPPRERGAERSGSIPDAESLGEVLGQECRRALERRL